MTSPRPPSATTAERTAVLHHPVKPGTPAYNAINALGSAAAPPPRLDADLKIEGERVRVQSRKSPLKIAEQLQRKVYLNSVRSALLAGRSMPPIPEGMSTPPDSDELRVLLGRKHIGPLNADMNVERTCPPRPDISVAPSSVTLSSQMVPALPHEQEARLCEESPAMMRAYLPGITPMPIARLSDSIRPFIRLIDQKKYSRPAIGDHMLTLRILVETIGNKVLSDITNTDMDDFLNVLGSWPTNATVRREFREMRAPEIAAKAKKLGVATLSLKTQQRHIDRLKEFLRFCERRRELFPGLLDGVRVYRKSQDFNPGRDVYTDDELQIILGWEAAQTMSNPIHYWGPRLALYLGLRVNEVAQLYIDDVQNIGGIPCIQITKERPGQRLKNRFSYRVMPIHPELLRLGFLNFVDQSKSYGRKTLFPLLSWGTNGPGDTLGDWYNGAFLRKTCGITNGAKTFHSFRHTFATLAELSELPDARIALLLGHSAGQSILREHYIKPPSIEDRMRNLLAIRFPKIEHPLYDQEQYREAFEKDAASERRKRLLDEIYGPAALKGPH